MAEEIALDLLVKADGSIKTVSDLKKEIKDLQNEAIKAKAAGDDMLSAKFLDQAGKAKDVLNDIREEVASLDPGAKAQAFVNLGQTIAGGFAAATAASQMFGLSNENVEKQLLRVQQATALLQGVQALADAKRSIEIVKQIALVNLQTGAESSNIVVKYASIAAQKLLNATMSANPIGVVIVAVTALVAAYALLSDEAEETEKSQEELNKEFERTKQVTQEAYSAISEFSNSYIALRKAQGASEQELLKLQLQAFKDKDILLKDELKLNQQHIKNIQKNQEEGWQDEVDKLNQRNFAISQLLAANRNNEATAQLNFEAEQKKKQEEKDRQEQEAYNKRIDELRAKNKDIQSIDTITLEETTKAVEDANNKKIQLDFDYWQKKAELIAVEVQAKEAQQAKEEELEKAREHVRQIELAAEQRVAAARLSIANSGVKGLMALNDIFVNDGKKHAKFQKALAITQIAIDTAKSIASLTAMSQANPANAVTFGGAGAAQFISGIAQILANIAQAKQILSQGDQQGLTGGGGGSMNINIPQSTPINVLPEFEQEKQEERQRQQSSTLLTDNNTGGSNQRVYVVESDIRDTGRRVQLLEQRATF